MSTSSASGTPYTFDNDRPTAGPLLDHLGAMLDGFSRHRLTQAGIRPGARCLELGAGTGSFAAWMADQVGPDGEVIATDIKPQHIRAHSGVTVLHHNILTDPLPEGRFGVIHARLLLAHLPSRRDILARLARVLEPGGALVVEEWVTSWRDAVLATPDPQALALFGRYHDAFQQVLRGQGNDPSWARGVYSAMLDAGLTDVDTEVHAKSWPGGSPGCLLPIATTTEIQPKLVAAGMSVGDLDRLRELLRDPRLVIQSNLLVSTIGRAARHG